MGVAVGVVEAEVVVEEVEEALAGVAGEEEVEVDVVEGSRAPEAVGGVEEAGG